MVMPTGKKLGYAAWITVCLVWGTTYFAIRIALETVPVSLLAGLRWLGAGVLLTAILPLLGHRLPKPRTWGSLLVLGILMNVGGNGLVVFAQQSVPSGLTAVLVAMVPFWVVLVELAAGGGERLRWRAVTGLLVGFSGIVLLVWPQLGAGGAEGRAFVIGILALQAACLSWALGTSYTKRRTIDASPLAAAAVQMVFAGLLLTAVGSARGDWGALSFSWRSGAAMAYLVIFGSILGYTSYVYALKYLPVSTVSLYAYINPIIAVLLGTLLLAEPFTLRIVFAAVLVFAGVGIVRSQPALPPAAPEEQKAA
ncbi:MAG: EamA family transporter [Vicinamibacterales bacterium]|nr:EamA family transporter [Vicinamibacterales bacterium]